MAGFGYNFVMKPSGWDSLERLSPAELEAAAKISEEFFRVRREKANPEAFRRLLNRNGGEPPRPEDRLD